MAGSCVRRVALPAVFRAALGAVLGAALAACSDGGGTPRDAAIDTPPDAPGTCGTADTFFTSEVVDWDSTETKFCGVRSASVTVRGRSAPAVLSNPNGRFELCIPRQGPVMVNIAPPSAATECPGLSGTYSLPGVLVTADAVVAAGAFYSARMMLESRVTSMFNQIGEPLATGQGQLFVHVIGTPRAVSISAGHATTQRFDGASWSAGDTGSDVLFPNVDPAAPVAITVAGGAVGTGSYTVEAGKLTYLTVIAN